MSETDKSCVQCGSVGQDGKNAKPVTMEPGFFNPTGRKKTGPKAITIVLAIAIALGGVWGLLAKQSSNAENRNKPTIAQDYGAQSAPDTNLQQQAPSAGAGLKNNNDNAINPGQIQTSIVLAAVAGDTQAVQNLLNQSKDPNASEYVEGLGYCTALMASAAKGHIDIVNLLINWGVDKSVYNVQGYDALAYAAENNNADMAKLLINSGANPDRALGVATVDGSLEMVKLLLNAGANPNNNAVDRHLAAPLHLAASLTDGSDIILTLIQSGGNVNQTDMYGETPLFIAVEESSAANARLLLENGANPNLKNTNGETTLKKALTAEIKNLLQSYGAVQ
jgi:FOG: Ankyrin repeat